LYSWIRRRKAADGLPLGFEDLSRASIFRRIERFKAMGIVFGRWRRAARNVLMGSFRRGDLVSNTICLILGLVHGGWRFPIETILR
jgi:hypothetical protein